MNPGSQSVNPPRARAIAFYLPQFHPTPENDAWWGKGFTEWTNVAKARPLYPGHEQPRLPEALGFYDLRLPEVREAQADLAARHGVEAFCYWHYWFGGRRILERPFMEVLASGEPDFPFCLAWANETWSGIWVGAEDRTLLEQTYPGEEDHRRHFDFLLPAFQDHRYVKVDGKPLFAVYQPRHLPNPHQTLDFWRELAGRAGLRGIHFVALLDHWEMPLGVKELGFDALCYSNQLTIRTCVKYRGFHADFRKAAASSGSPSWTPARCQAEIAGFTKVRARSLIDGWRGRPDRFAYEDARRYFVSPFTYDVPAYPSIVPGWDNTPRSGKRGVILEGATPELFGRHVDDVLAEVARVDREHRIVFIKSWNEWAEGNYMEPDLQYGDAFLRVLRDRLMPS